MLIKSVWILVQVFVARTLSVQSQIIGQCVPVILVIMENHILNAEEQLVSYCYNVIISFGSYEGNEVAGFFVFS